MSNLLHELTDEEVKVSLSNGGSTCSTYANAIAGLMISCQMSHLFGGDSQCSELRTMQNWYNAHC
ncbi:hypothetical protein OfM1_02490 [Lactovum odontotermitis]